MSRAVFAVASMFVGLSLAAPVRAGTDTDQLAVTATVLSACSLSGGTLSFGTYTSGQTANLDVNGTINYVNCSGSLSFALDGGGSGNVNGRQMSSSSSGRLNYQIYRNAARNAIWGTGSDAHGVVLIGTQSGTVTVYGRIPANQVASDGIYTDTVNITLTF